MYSVTMSGLGNQFFSSITPIRKKYVFVGSIGIGFAVGGLGGALGVGAAYLAGKKICQTCDCSRAIQNIYSRLFGKTQHLDELLSAVLKTNPVDNFATYHKLRKKRDFLRRSQLEEWNGLLNKIGTLNRSPLSIAAIEAFRLGKWDHPIFKHQDWPVLVFYAYLEGLLEEKYLHKLVPFDACCRETHPNHPVRTFQLIDRERNVNPEALAVLQRGMEGYFSKQCIKAIVEKLRALPPETSQFFEIHQSKEASDTFHYLTYTDFHPFLCQDAFGKNYIQTVLPPEFVYEILKVRFGKNARRPNPVLGYHKIEKMSLVDQRVVALSLGDYIKLPKQLHDFTSTPLGYYQHDAIYHLFVDSANKHRAAWIEIAQLFKIKKEETIVEHLFDGDFPPYSRSIRANPQLEPLSLCRKPLEKDDEKFWGMFIMIVARWHKTMSPDSAVDLFCEYLQVHSEKWSRDYGLSINSLRQFALGVSKRIKAPNKNGHCLSEPEHLMRLLGKKLGLEKEFQLWPGFPSYEKSDQYQAETA